MVFCHKYFRLQTCSLCCRCGGGGLMAQIGLMTKRWKAVVMTHRLMCPIIASLFALSFPKMFVWALDLHMLILCHAFYQ